MKNLLLLFAGLAVACPSWSMAAADKRIVLIAGKTSHGPGDHEFRAGCLLLKKCLDQLPGITTTVHSNGWPSELGAFDQADAVLIYADGGAGHPAIQGDHRQVLADLVRKGVGLGFAHYGVEIPSTNGGPQFLEWVGGYYEHLYSVNPMWTPEFKSFPAHPVARGVKPFALLDEWYFNLRWKEEPGQASSSVEGLPLTRSSRLTPILVAKPSDAVRGGPYVYPRGPYMHIQESKDRAETMMWVYERPDAGRGFGFTGGHKHVNWADNNCRKVVLNALLWIAKADVPSDGVVSTVAPEELAPNLDPKNDSASFAANITGTWNFEVETPQGTGKPLLSFVHAGQNLIGHYQGRLGEANLSGSAKGSDAQWSFQVEFDGQPVTVTYKAKLEGKDRMKGTVALGELEGTWTAKRE